MRSKPAAGWGIGLVVLGVLSLAAAAVLAWVVVPDRKQMPSDTDTTRQFTGTAKVLLNPQALAAGDPRGALLTNVPITAQRTVKAVATDGDSAQVSDTRVLSTADGQRLGGTEATYAVDRKSLEAATDYPSTWTVTPHQGLTVSWPIGAKQQDYTGWVNETKKTTPLKYIRQESKAGLTTNVYQADTQAAPITDEQVLGALPRALPANALTGLASGLPIPAEAKAQLAQLLASLPDPVPLTYTHELTSTYWVEPTTGLVVDTQREEIRRAGLGLPSGGAVAAVPIYDVATTFTEQSVNDAVADANDAKDSINLYGRTLPLVLLILGLIALILGAVLLIASRSGAGRAAPVAAGAPTEPPQGGPPQGGPPQDPPGSPAGPSQ